MWSKIEKQFKYVFSLMVCLLLTIGFITLSIVGENQRLMDDIYERDVVIRQLEERNKSLSDMLKIDGRGVAFDDTVVYVNGSGEVYHRYSCQYVKASSYSKFLTDAKRDGMRACSKCW